MSKRLILCDCLGSQSIDAGLISKACDIECSRVYSNLCGSEADRAGVEIAKNDGIIACRQEQEFFEELAADLELEPPEFLDLRDRAGWNDGTSAGPKMAALVQDALRISPPQKSVDVQSEGVCLIVGKSAVVLPAAAQLAEALTVTVLLTDTEEPPIDRRFDVIYGELKKLQGALGNFRVTIDRLQQIEPGGRQGFALSAPRDGGQSSCDLFLDLTGGAGFVTAPQKRDGYFRADPGDPLAVANVVFQTSHMVGTFEKPLYVKLEEHLCAHSRAELSGCSNCLDVCPTGAIVADGDHVKIDPMICAGCGSCSALCPSGAIAFEAPPVQSLFGRITGFAQTFLKAGGTKPRLLVCDQKHGAEMIALAARFGVGLPANVIPMELESIAGFGHAEILSALASGFCHVDVLLAPDTEKTALEQEVALARALVGNDCVELLDISDPEALSAILARPVAECSVETAVLPLGDRRQVTRLAMTALHAKDTPPMELPKTAPYGAVLVDTDACTLCLSCASLCPSGALGDNPDKPQLRFQEDACLQCGICTSACPEDAISLVPQFNLSEDAFSQKVLHEEEPYPCVECGALFGVKSTVERVVEKLAGQHSMFKTQDASRLIRMCDTCRVNAQYHAEDNPFSGGERPRVRRTEDYYSERKDH